MRKLGDFLAASTSRLHSIIDAASLASLTDCVEKNAGWTDNADTLLAAITASTVGSRLFGHATERVLLHKVENMMDEEFLQLLDAAEGHARGLHGVNANVPQYIISKLGLNRDPLAELRQDMSQVCMTWDASQSYRAYHKFSFLFLVAGHQGDQPQK